jgi:NADPH:quinone reductase-like Zn-dependent oxidoreductase
MRAFAAQGYEGPEVMGLAALPDPVPGAGEVVVDVHAASVPPLSGSQDAHAEWLVVAASQVHRMCPGLTFEQAAALPTATGDPAVPSAGGSGPARGILAGPCATWPEGPP